MMQSLSSIDSDYHLTQQQIEQYQRDGHILLRNVCPLEDIEIYRHAIRQVVMEHAKNQKDLSERDTYGKAFLQVENIWTHDDTVKSFVFCRRFAQIAAQLCKVPGIRLYHDQALYKEGGGGITPWHQDQFYWPLDTSQSITMWMPLVDASRQMGTMGFASGSHKQGYLGAIPISDESESYYKDYVKKQGYTVTQSGDMKAGDATFHNGWTLHGAAPNQTQNTREVMTIIYYPDSTKLTKPAHEFQKIDFDALYHGKQPGQPAVSELTPVLFSE